MAELAKGGTAMGDVIALAVIRPAASVSAMISVAYKGMTSDSNLVSACSRESKSEVLQ